MKNPRAIQNPSQYGEEILRKELAEVIETLKRRLDIRLNNWLSEMEPNFDDSITGFNEAWDVMRGLFVEELARHKPSEEA